MYCLHHPSLTRESPFPVSETPCKNKTLTVLSTPAILFMTTKKMIEKRRVSRTTLARSTVVLLDDVLGMASVEFGGLAEPENCLVVHLAVASSRWLARHPSSLPFCPSVRHVPRRRKSTSSCARIFVVVSWWPCRTCLPMRVGPSVCTFLPSTQLPFAIRDRSPVSEVFQE